LKKTSVLVEKKIDTEVLKYELILSFPR
jgi:hypothetical protein